VQDTIVEREKKNKREKDNYRDKYRDRATALELSLYAVSL
jgi:hypothetical protein